MNHIGVIAEDNSDIEVVNQLAQKIAGKRSFAIRSFVGHGCGKIRGKCQQWASVLRARRCTSIILLHDLDERNLRELSEQLREAFRPCPIQNNIIIIPVREIEAWLLSDEIAIRKAMNLKDRVSRVPNPEALTDPKRKLEEIIYLRSRKTKRYINTVHNGRIAAAMSLERARRCASFRPLEEFLNTHLT